MNELTWSLESVTVFELKIKVELENQELFDGRQYVSIRANFSDFEPEWDDNNELARSDIPKQKVIQVTKETVATVSSVGSATQAASAATVGANVMMSGAIS